LFAASPIVAAAVGLARLRPPDAVATDDRRLVLAAGDTAAVARCHPGEAAISIDDLDAQPQLDRLPFESVVREDGDPGEPWGAAAPWTVLESWSHWQVDASHGGVADPCNRRFANGGYGCGHGVRWIPDVVRVGDVLLGAVRVTPVPAGSVTHLTVPRLPAGAQGTLWALGDRPVRLRLTRGDASADVACAAACDFEPPPGDAPLRVEVAGPSPALAFDLRAPQPGDRQ